MNNSDALMIKSSVDTWLGQVARVDALLNGLTDEDMHREVAPGRNTGMYLLGHLAAVHDLMLPLLNLGESLRPELHDPFIQTADKSGQHMPAVSDLRIYWKHVNDTLAGHFKKLQPEEWMQKHTAVSDEDFNNEPHRNRLNVLFSRTNHLSYHFGQLAFLKK